MSYSDVLRVLCGSMLLTCIHAESIEDAYREGKAALEGGNAARTVELLAPFDAAGKADPMQLAIARLALGRAYLLEGKPADARDTLLRIGPGLDATPSAAAVAALLADAHRLLGSRADAEREYMRTQQRAGDALLGRYAGARLNELRAGVAEAAGNYAQAAELYLDAADSLLALGKEDRAYFADSRALFEKVARGSEAAPPGRDWRGEPTARAVFSMGEIERLQEHYPEAIAYYQRTFVSWAKYPQWAARAYLRAAECMDKLGKREFAIRHLREMLWKPAKYGKLPEFEAAKQQLKAWGQEVR